MNAEIKATNIELTPAIKDYLAEKVMYLEKFVDLSSENNMLEIEVAKTTDHHRHGEIFRTELNLSISGNFFRAESERETLYESIDEAKDDLIRQVKNDKEKKQTVVRKGALKFKKMFRRFYGREDEE